MVPQRFTVLIIPVPRRLNLKKFNVRPLGIFKVHLHGTPETWSPVTTTVTLVPTYSSGEVGVCDVGTKQDKIYDPETRSKTRLRLFCSNCLWLGQHERGVCLLTNFVFLLSLEGFL